MAKRGRKKKSDLKVGAQMELIEVGPENLKEISKHLKVYKDAQTKRLAALKIETEKKQVILDLVHKAGLGRLPDGRIRFTCDGLLVEVTPTDEVIKIKKGPDKPGAKGDKSMQQAVEETE